MAERPLEFLTWNDRAFSAASGDHSEALGRGEHSGLGVWLDSASFSELSDGKPVVAAVSNGVPTP